MKIAYFDCFSGASGDMLVGALLDAGLALDALRAELARLPLADYALSVERRQQHGVGGSKFDVAVDHDAHHHHRHFSDIEAILAGSTLLPADQARALAAFRRLARAESKVHGVPIEEVHFHEVGAVDSIVDMVGFVIGLRLLEIEAGFCSALPLGGGFVQTQHGRLPVPAPATAEIIAEAAVPTRPSDIQAELVTPTGAALLAEFCQFRQPPMRPTRVGYGFGTRQLPTLNAVRVLLGEALAPAAGDAVVELVCNIDDMTGEQLGFAMARLLEAGALDVWLTPIQMKKGRPATQLSVLSKPQEADGLRRLLLRETSTLGVRYREWQREIAGRENVEVATPWGPARVKVKRLDGEAVSAAPEYEDCAALARQAGVSLAQVYEAALAGWRRGQD